MTDFPIADLGPHLKQLRDAAKEAAVETVQSNDKLMEILSEVLRQRRYVICYSSCESCQWGEHPGIRHSWAGDEDITWAKSQGHEDPSKSLCGCYCQKVYRPVPKPPRQLLHNGRKP